MSKTLCKNSDELKDKVKKKEAKYYCKKCDRKSPKEKWLCKPKEL